MKNLSLTLISFFFILSVASSENYIDNNSIKENLNCNIGSFENVSFTNKAEEISIEIPNSSAWSRNVFEAFLENKTYILEKYKKKFYAKVTLKSGKNKKCLLESKIRIHGDNLDHIDISNPLFQFNTNNTPLTSLDVDLKVGNVNNIVKFKLLIPETRNSENYIILQSILSELGFITPITKLINVNVNQTGKKKYLFLQKPSKEMLERHGFKEGPILAVDETYLWSKTKRKDTYLPKLVNNKWASTSDEHLRISKEALDVISLIYLDYHQRHAVEKTSHIYELYYKILENEGYDFSAVKKYDLSLIALNSQHGLHPNNRKFYFDPLGKKFVPISNDEDPLLKKYELPLSINNQFFIDFSLADEVLFDLSNIDIDKLYSKVNLLGVEVSRERLKHILIDAKSNLNIYRKNNKKNELSSVNYSNYFKKIDAEVFFSKYKKNKIIFEKCRFDKCEEIELENKEKSKIFSNKKDKGVQYITDSSFYKGEKIIIKKNNNFSISNFENGNIYYNDKVKFNIDSKNRVITINQINPEGRFVFYNTNLKNYKIIFNGIKKKYLKDQSRISDFNLTGCLTFKNVFFNTAEIFVKNTGCEDAVNIVNSSGVINMTEISDTSSDALDVDFSQLNFNKINISNALNDCIDFSFGKYEAKDINLLSCGDKGVSVGEKSTFNVDNLSINKTKIAFASKDSSLSSIKSLFSENYEYCLLAYRKKQEFSGGKITIKKNNCLPKTSFSDKYSNIRFIK